MTPIRKDGVMVSFSFKHSILSIALLALAILAYALPGGVSCASEAEIIDAFMADLDGDGRMEAVSFQVTSVSDEEPVGFLRVKTADRTYGIDIGVLDSVDMAFVETIQIAKIIKPFIVVSIPGGAHGMRTILYSFDEKGIKKEISIFSDAPSIEFYDIDNDGVDEIVSKNRDYDHDPIADSVVAAYKYVNDRWSLVSLRKTDNQQRKAE